MFFTSKEAAKITGCTLRQLQYWREKEVVVPTVDATGKGRSVFYTEDDLVSLAVMEYLLSAGLEFQEAVAGLEAVKKEEPEFFKPTQTRKFAISRNLTDETLTFAEFNFSDAIASVKSGQPVIPLWLERIHRRLRQKLANMGKIEQVEELENKKFASISNETNTCRKYVEPKLREALWESEPHDYTEQYYFTAGKIQSKRKRRGKRKFVDYLLLYKSEFPIAVVEAKRKHKTPDEGLEKAIDYAKLLGVKFAYSTNGKGIVEFDFITGKQSDVIETFPTPSQLWLRLTGEADEQIKTEVAEKLVTSMFPTPGKKPRYYQRNAIYAAVSAIIKGQKRLLLTMATGTGKTSVAFQICWMLTGMKWNTIFEPRPPRILFLADRNILVDDPMNKDFAAFEEDKIYKIQREAKKGRDIYFAIYQAIAEDNFRPGLYKEYSPDYFDLIIVDECHRGSAKSESSWRSILEYFEPAYQLGLTATPLRNDNVDTYRYFGNPLYTYSLKEGIEDGFLAPYRVYRVTTRSDKDGWRPSEGQLDCYGRTIPNEAYLTPDFEQRLVREARTKAIAQHLTDFLKATDRYAKTIVFCVDEEHVKAMIKALRNLNTDITKDNADYITRITSDAGVVGKGHLDDFKDVEDKTHIIAVTSKLLTTGVDIPTCKNIVLARVIRSMSDFKQIIGRGTRVREEYDKISFNIIDYTKSTVLFEDPDFDGEPALVEETEIDDEGKAIEPETEEQEQEDTEESGFRGLPSDEEELPRKYYVDGGTEEIVEEQIYDPDAENQLKLSKLIDYTKEQVRILYRSTLEIQQKWADPDRRSQVIELLEEKGIDFEELQKVANQPEADPFDLICHIAFDAPVLTYKQRVERLKRRKKDFFEQYGEDAREILEILLNKYAEYGVKELEMPTTFKANREFESYGNVREIAEKFGGIPQLKEAVYQLQNLLYSA
ncbi:EcoAI/FtnUII family type I restriction enzme subunit R [Myxosarcina sp. GI1]|uniref:EcoAI/FtnUII family type I restriction enzme subunit R n=1 Tax=Myxosarcina sp. GI1 TaxID=1541065 RepID=UPI0009DEA6EE|nr:DEAD/DEAH box helicase family protein [Myxosarcina sp. GI1]